MNMMYNVAAGGGARPEAQHQVLLPVAVPPERPEGAGADPPGRNDVWRYGKHTLESLLSSAACNPLFSHARLCICSGVLDHRPHPHPGTHLVEDIMFSVSS